MESIRIKNSKNKNIAAVVHSPSIQSKKLAILCPGYLDTKDYPHLVELANRLSEIGYTVVRFDPTGAWGSEGDISEYLTSQYLEDIKAVLEQMLAMHEYTQVLLGGHSRGGQVAILYAARDPRISAVLAIMPSHGPIEGVAREKWQACGFKISERDVPGSSKYVQFKVPFQHVLDRNQFDALDDVKKIKAPIIFVAGETDNLVTPQDVKELYEAANEPKKFILLEGIGHGYRRNVSEIEKVNTLVVDELLKLY
jgi:pimeloyl-ACP methyl ester carboxylesterase